MCGIVGLLTAETTTKGWLDRRKFMEQALIIDTLRGDDSTGVFYQGHEGIGHAGWLKTVEDGYDFVHNPKFQALAKDMEKYWFMVGHNRAATVGEVNVQGAHPFQEGPITLVHNGTLRSTWSLPKSLAQLDGVEVDSHALCHNLAEVGPSHDELKEVIEKIDGAFTLVWHDARDGSLNIIRNDERPLHIAQSGNQDTLYFASEAMQLSWLDARLRLGLRDIMYPEPGVHLKWVQGSLVPEVASFDVRPRYNRYAGYDRAPYGGQSGYLYDYEDDADYEAWWQAQRGGKPRPPAQDNRVLVGGRRREIPQRSQELLLRERLVPADRLLFTPMALHEKKAGFVCVVGHLDSCGLPAVLYHTESSVAKAAFDRRWLVRPVSINMVDPERNQPIVVCKLVTSVGAKGDEVWHAALPPEAEDSTSSGSEDGASYTDVCPLCHSTDADDCNMECLRSSPGHEIGGIRGPFNRYYSLEQWKALHEEGCAFCSDPVYPEDAKDMMWYDDEYPLCPTCTLDQRWADDDLKSDLPW